VTARKLTPQEAVEKAVAERGLGAGGDDYSAAVRAIELYESSRKRVELTPEQAGAFSEKVHVLSVVTPITKGRLTTFLDTRFHTPASLRNLAAACEALAANLEEFPS
jgi:hypothetical protein